MKKKKKTPTRKGAPLKILVAGDTRRMSDGRNAWKNMTEGQRVAFLFWIATSDKLHLHPIPEGWTVECAPEPSDFDADGYWTGEGTPPEGANVAPCSDCAKL